MPKVLLLVATLLLFPSYARSQTKTITRVSDPIIIKGAQIPPLRGIPLSRIALYSSRNGAAAPVTFQIDEADESGALSLSTPDGSAINSDDGKWDDNDELVFMSCDLGDRMSAAQLPAGYLAAAEISCADPITQGSGWVYCVSFSEPVREVAPPYVRYDSKRDYVATDRYEIGYTPGGMKSYFSTLILKDNDSVHSPNILDRYKFRVTMKLFFSLITITRNEDDMRAVLAGYKDGPIRAVRRCNNSLYLKFGIRSPTSMVDNYYYRDSIEWPTLIRLPFNVSTVASEALLISGCDWNPTATGMNYFNSCNQVPVLVDGFMSDEEKKLDKKPYLWSALSGPQGTMLSRLWLSESLVMGKELLYMDDKTIMDAPGGCTGHWGYNGWAFNIITVPAGTHRFVSCFYFPKDYRRGDENAYLNILDHPVTVSVRQMTGDSPKIVSTKFITD
ncbi:MAG: hypothetical protein NTZ78_05125 [Candidatus Aureabacteria bacterium]|nr:hypothetical protein [Candidatus Auribacterota bacterium]